MVMLCKATRTAGSPLYASTRRVNKIACARCGTFVPKHGGRLYCTPCSDVIRVESMRDYRRRKKVAPPA